MNELEFTLRNKFHLASILVIEAAWFVFVVWVAVRFVIWYFGAATA